MTSTPDRAEVLTAIQEKRRGGWAPESIPGRNADEEGKRAVEAIERNAITEFLRSEEALEKFAEAVARQKTRTRGTSSEHPSIEDIFFCKIEAEAVLETLTEAVG